MQWRSQTAICVNLAMQHAVTRTCAHLHVAIHTANEALLYIATVIISCRHHYQHHHEQKDNRIHQNHSLSMYT